MHVGLLDAPLGFGGLMSSYGLRHVIKYNITYTGIVLSRLLKTTIYSDNLTGTAWLNVAMLTLYYAQMFQRCTFHGYPHI